MSKSDDYQFVSMDTEALAAALVAGYERLTKTSVQPASPERLFIQWVAAVILQERLLNNYTANQNLPSRAEGENLDALAELFYAAQRPEAKPAACTERFFISEAQDQAILIPAGTRVTDESRLLIWETAADVYIPAGDLSADVTVYCQTAGAAGNGFAAGQLNTAVDVFAYYSSCRNITVSGGGSDRASDAEFYELLRASQDAYSTAGARGAYIYHAKRVSTEIADVVANSPEPGEVNIYLLLQGGQSAGEELKKAVLAAASADEVRPLTDHVTVCDIESVGYTVDLTYYVPEDTPLRPGDIEAAVNAAISEYTKWQSARLGRDINPSYLIKLLMQTGIKRAMVRQPAFTVLSDGHDDTVPQVARVSGINIVNGGYEHD